MVERFVRAPKIGFATFSLSYLALGLLVPGANHGYQLYQNYLDAFGEIWSVGRSKFYATLGELEDAGFLSSTLLAQTDRPARKIYKLMKKGRTRFMKWVYQPVLPVRAIRVELMAKLRFFDLLQLPDAEKLIDAQLEICRKMLRGWEQKLDEEQEKGEDEFIQRVYDFRLRQARFIVEWLKAWRKPIGS